MPLRNLKYRLQVNRINGLYFEDRFIANYGVYNCKTLKFKDANTVIKIMNDFDESCLDLKDKEFIVKNSNKEVLCSINNVLDEDPDIFVYGDDNIAFRTSCFV